MPEQFPHLLVLGCGINSGTTESLKQDHSKSSMRNLKLNQIFVNKLQRKSTFVGKGKHMQPGRLRL